MVAPPSKHATDRPLVALLLLILIPTFAGALISPWVFRFAATLREIFPGVEWLEEATFERVTNRCVLFSALVLLVPLARMSGLWPEIRGALRISPNRRCALLGATLVGVGSIVALYFTGWLLGAYIPSYKTPSVGRLLLLVPDLILGGLFVGFFEESLFRGFVFGALRRRLPWFVAAIFAALFFSAVHFIHPTMPKPVTDPLWSSGFDLLRHCFSDVTWWKIRDYAAVLFLMGLTLCVAYHRQRHLYTIIGLHMGWVIAMRYCNAVLDRDLTVLVPVFGRTGSIGEAGISIVMMAIFLLVALAYRPSARV